MPELSEHESALVNYLEHYISRETQKCTPSYRQMAKAIGLTDRQCQRLVEKLVKRHIIEKEEHWFLYPRESAEARTGNLYRVVANNLTRKVS